MSIGWFKTTAKPKMQSIKSLLLTASSWAYFCRLQFYLHVVCCSDRMMRGEQQGMPNHSPLTHCRSTLFGYLNMPKTQTRLQSAMRTFQLCQLDQEPLQYRDSRLSSCSNFHRGQCLRAQEHVATMESYVSAELAGLLSDWDKLGKLMHDTYYKTSTSMDMVNNMLQKLVDVQTFLEALNRLLHAAMHCTQQAPNSPTSAMKAGETHACSRKLGYSNGSVGN